MEEDKIVIVGAGITGLTVAERLSRSFGNRVIVIEKEKAVGGLAATLSNDGLSFDIGSHRLHPKSDPSAIHYLKQITQQPLLLRRRRGKLYLGGKFISYPPTISGLFKVYSTADIATSTVRYLKNLLFPAKLGPASFETAMIRTVGWDIYNKVYRDYARKLWGVDPARISVDAMHRRKTVVDFKSLGNAFKIRHYFLYPRKGIGELVSKLEERVIANGACLMRETRLKEACEDNGRIRLSLSGPQEKDRSIAASLVVSTIPIDELYGLFFSDERIARNDLRWRGIRILYLIVKERLNDSGETFYFPSSEILFGRVSEIKKYSPFINPSLKETLLTIEVPVSPGEALWEMPEEELLKLCIADLIKAKLLEKNPKVIKHFSLKLEKVYPVYMVGWRESFFAMYHRLAGIRNVFTIGRGGLFLHCNIDHCIIQGLAMADSILGNTYRDRSAWERETARFFNFSARD